MRKYLFSFSVLAATAGIASTIRQARQASSPVRVIAAWAGFAASVLLAVSAVHEKTQEQRELTELD